jgi:hypothetical protein
MNCEQARPALVHYLLEEIPARERETIAQHLESCAPCSRETARLRQTLEMVVRGEASEEVPQRIRLVAEPAGWRQAFWRDTARVAFAGAGLLALVIATLALFRATVSYQQGNLQIAFGAAAAGKNSPQLSATGPAGVQAAGVQAAAGESQSLDRAQVLRLIAEAVAASEAKQQAGSEKLVRTISERSEQQRQSDLREMAEGIRVFQAAQTMMWKDQVQSQSVMSALMRQVGFDPSAQR